ncbi:thioredoxin domain-containing protein [Gordonia zhaorongruii]|uniref:thioredoxin domain-containing protein n=1 Tax=Gordonia zhaorongruii TaxID=2597659 RepID=UPI00104C86C8|nr:thioredoxin domain-containing protein [Gordonia zhaorongruii]
MKETEPEASSRATGAEGARGNLLGASSSPYLRQHAANPVHWQEWGDDAFGEARRRDVPVLLSIGYAACHWCHVMAHETFEDDVLAAQMNENFVCIKVDREERPDIDSIYMSATLAMTGQGGWPMTSFLTPDGDPFYCGTYFPPQPRGGMPGFGDVMDAITRTWTTRRDEVILAGGKITEHLRANASTLPDGPQLDVQLLADAVDQVLAAEDPIASGFGGAPKFPPSAMLEGLLRASEYTGDPAGLDATRRTCHAMARGGIYDQLAGGFARYAVDGAWVVPHFEKMLYDNAQLLRAYAHLARRTDDPLAVRVTQETVAFLDEALWTGTGYASSLDADTEGVEGLTYVWRPTELVEVLGADDGAWAAETFTVTDEGTFEHGTSTLQLLRDPDDAARYASVRHRLLQARAQRPQPDRDDKVVTGWNALTVTALVEAGVALDRPEWIDRAAECASSLLNVHLVDGDLRRSSLDGSAANPLGALDDYAALATALFTLHSVTGDDSWRTAGTTILDRAIEVFAVKDEPGAWYDAHPGGLLLRPRDPIDGATPSGASLIAEALLTGAAVTDTADQSRYLALADATLARAGIVLAKAARSAGHWLAVAQAYVAGPIQVGVAQTAGSDGGLAASIRRSAPGGAVVLAGAEDSTPILIGRGPVDRDGGSADAAYVCRGAVCALPVTSLDDVDAWN